ncbi:ribosome biogenesis GTP-binding protein YihA/YsxC [Qipengyuania sp. 1NDW9]|uniref:Probable GTP-binding protein EngB n=1 Tax=Qipengyuania xiapuensis TaxID=2867236 RepID=A0ABX8ZXB5_9SPHN|nr:ribosome biogenesis GTP-binding protein YihA/YsxC [Qipengyuania xiapuensis]MBX7492111.1 ribosome biogenesis GTP-binding protein YihA/YsxC [Qipengyuania xiapuensis]QZD93645.1 ribosome biogenesis GTP-binding protein YihA/YsxC [Qipengyuania xiapuensis]
MTEEEAAELAQLERRANKLFSGRVEFLLSAPQLKFLPEPTVPEIAFAGRSNVGKSSLLNALTGRKAIARTSVTPGRTQELNFFEVGEPTQFRLVDMPGYGFAKAPVKVVEKWKNLVRTYLRGRQVLVRNLVLVDSRHGLKDVDREMMKMLDEAAVGYRIVMTKADKIKASELAKTVAAVEAEAKKHVAAYPHIHVTSSEKGMGIGELRAALLQDAGV